MHKKLFCLLLSAIALSAAAQPAAPDQYAASITKESLKKQLTIIAGPEMEGRETGTEGQRKAAAYIVSQFKAFGLKSAPGTDNYQQYYSIGYDSLISSQLIVGGHPLTSGTDYTDQVGINESGIINAKEIVFAGYGISDAQYDDYVGKDVKGKVVVAFASEPKKDGKFYLTAGGRFSLWAGASKKAEIAKQKGAVALIIIDASMDSIVTARFSKKSNNRLILASKAINCVIVAGGTVKNILSDDFFTNELAKAKAGEPLNTDTFSKKLKIQYDYKETQILNKASNVAGYIEGTDKKDEYVILTGHYDHLGIRNGLINYGADDDGSGTCAVIEMAEAFSKAKAAGNGPRRSVVFMTVSGEEKGLWGSEYYSENPLFPLDKTSVDLNTDMIGRIDTERKTADTLNYVYVIGHDKLSSELVGINEAANSQYTGLVLDYKYDDPTDKNRIYYRSDHYNFARKGVPILFFYDGMLQADYHKPTDTVDKIYWDIYEKRTRMIFYTAWQMANRDEMIKRDIPLN